VRRGWAQVSGSLP